MTTILIVDDDDVLRELIGISLSRDVSLSLEYAESGAEALVRLEAPGIDVLLLDVMMPELSGPSLLNLIRERSDLREIPAIFLTAAAHADDKSILLSHGALGVITKPFDPFTLASTVLSLLGRSL